MWRVNVRSRALFGRFRSRGGERPGPEGAGRPGRCCFAQDAAVGPRQMGGWGAARPERRAGGLARKAGWPDRCRLSQDVPFRPRRPEGAVLLETCRSWAKTDGEKKGFVGAFGKRLEPLEHEVKAISLEAVFSSRKAFGQCETGRERSRPLPALLGAELEALHFYSCLEGVSC